MIQFFKFLILFLFISIQSMEAKSQCIASAGFDKVVCSTFNGIETKTIGGNPSANLGSPPYIYKWETLFTIGSYTLTASDFLDDTSIANPTIVNGGVDSLKFILTVMDSLGIICKDSVKITFSNFGYILQDKFITINQGDSAQISPGVGGGIPPVLYEWTPKINLSNPFIANPWASPDSSTYYVVTATDAAGCQATDPDVFEVYVNPVGINDFSTLSSRIQVYPNPLVNQSKILFNSTENKLIIAKIIDSNGRLIKQIDSKNNVWQIERNDFEVGFYSIQLIDENKVIASKKLIVQ